MGRGGDSPKTTTDLPTEPRETWRQNGNAQRFSKPMDLLNRIIRRGDGLRECRAVGEPLSPVGRSRGEREEEPAALAWAALCPDVAAVLLDDAAGEGETQAGTAQGAGIGGVSLVEALEDFFQLFRGDAAALIFDDETYFAAASCLGARGN